MKPYWQKNDLTIYHGDAREVLASLPVGLCQTCVTSPPYWGLRDYGVEGQLGLEPTPEEYVEKLVTIFDEVRRVLRPDGTVFLNLGDSYASGKGTCYNPGGGADSLPVRAKDAGGLPLDRGSVVTLRQSGLKPKDLVGIPWRVAFALQADGWWLRSAITWCKGNAMPESCRDRPTSATEMIYLLTKEPRYYYDSDAVRVLAGSLNRFHALYETPLELGTQGAAPGSLSAQRCQVSLNDEWAPYLVLSALLTMKRILVKQRDDDFRQLLDAFQNPFCARAGIGIVAGLLEVEQAPNVALNVFKHLQIVLAQDDLQSEAELRIRLRAFPAAVPEDDATFSIEEASEVMTKIVANAQTIRDAFPFDSLAKGVVDVNMISEAITLLEGSDFGSRETRNGVITQPVFEKLLLALRSSVSDDTSSSVGHCIPPVDGAHAIHNTTKPPATQGANLRNWWYVNTQSFPGAHFAVFPEKLIEPCIRAGSAARACAECGAAWERVVRRGNSEHHCRPGCGCKERDGELQNWSDGYAGYGNFQNTAVATNEFRPTCTCDAGTTPSIVLDPFLGGGTTLLVAYNEGRRGIGVDLSEEYCELAAKRLEHEMKQLRLIEPADVAPAPAQMTIDAPGEA